MFYLFAQRFCHLRNECLFFWVHGEWIVARDKPIACLGDLFVLRYDSFPMNPEKQTLVPYIYNVSNISTLSKILWEKLWIQNSHSNEHLTSFDVLITAHAFWPNRRTFCWLCSSGIELKNFSRVQRRKIWYHCKYYVMTHRCVGMVLKTISIYGYYFDIPLYGTSIHLSSMTETRSLRCTHGLYGSWKLSHGIWPGSWKVWKIRCSHGKSWNLV